MIAIIPFTFETSEIRSIVDGQDNPWFVGRDIAAALGYVNPPEAMCTHCKKAQPIEILGVSVSLTLQKSNTYHTAIGCNPAHCPVETPGG